VSTEIQERAILVGTAIEHGDVVSRPYQVRRHRGTHVAEADKSNFHVMSP
jgi:hypothetical protein